MQTGEQTDVVIFDANDIERSLKRLTHELIEFNQGVDDLVLVGIVTRGKPLAERVGKLLQELEGKQVPVAETVKSFKEILEGKHDDVPEGNFYMKGGINEIKEG